MENMETDDLLNQVFAAPIYLPPVKFSSNTTKADQFTKNFLKSGNDFNDQQNNDEKEIINVLIKTFNENNCWIKQELESIEALNEMCERKSEKDQESQTKKSNGMIRDEEICSSLSSTKKTTTMKKNEFVRKKQIDEGENELQILNAENEKFNSIRVVKNVRQYVKLWTKSNGLDGPKIFPKRNLLTAKKINKMKENEKNKH
ncbi:hypothetical protein ACH3XW_43835 [Acanthocheilonema viteae]